MKKTLLWYESNQTALDTIRSMLPLFGARNVHVDIVEHYTTFYYYIESGSYDYIVTTLLGRYSPNQAESIGLGDLLWVEYMGHVRTGPSEVEILLEGDDLSDRCAGPFDVRYWHLAHSATRHMTVLESFEQWKEEEAVLEEDPDTEQYPWRDGYVPGVAPWGAKVFTDWYSKKPIVMLSSQMGEWGPAGLVYGILQRDLSVGGEVPFVVPTRHTLYGSNRQPPMTEPRLLIEFMKYDKYDGLAGRHVTAILRSLEFQEEVFQGLPSPFKNLPGRICPPKAWRK